MEDLRGKGGGRPKHRTIDGDVPLCLRKTEKESNDDSSSKGKKREEKESGSHTEQNEALCHEQNGERKQRYVFTLKRDDDTKNKEVSLIILQKI